MSWTGIPGTYMSRPNVPAPGAVPGTDALQTCVRSMDAPDDRELSYRVVRVEQLKDRRRTLHYPEALTYPVILSEAKDLR